MQDGCVGWHNGGYGENVALMGPSACKTPNRRPANSGRSAQKSAQSWALLPLVWGLLWLFSLFGLRADQLTDRYGGASASCAAAARPSLLVQSTSSTKVPNGRSFPIWASAWDGCRERALVASSTLGKGPSKISIICLRLVWLHGRNRTNTGVCVGKVKHGCARPVTAPCEGCDGPCSCPSLLPSTVFSDVMSCVFPMAIVSVYCRSCFGRGRLCEDRWTKARG